MAKSSYLLGITFLTFWVKPLMDIPKDVGGMNTKELQEWTDKKLDYLVTSRPTGVNLRIECSSLKGNFISLAQCRKDFLLQFPYVYSS